MTTDKLSTDNFRGLNEYIGAGSSLKFDFGVSGTSQK
jgi:hypothetical protein